MRLLDDPARVAVLYKNAILQHHQLVNRLCHESHVVADQDQCGADPLLNVLQGLHDLALRDDVEGRGRFVGNDEVRVQDHAQRNADPLLHPAGKLVRIQRPGMLGQSHPRECVGKPCPQGVPFRAALVRNDRVLELVLDPHHRVQGVHRALRNVADATQPRPAHPVFRKRQHVLVPEANRAAAHESRTCQHSHDRKRRRGLARSGLANDSKPTASRHGEREVGQCMNDTASGGKVNREIRHVQDVHRATPHPEGSAGRQGTKAGVAAFLIRHLPPEFRRA